MNKEERLLVLACLFVVGFIFIISSFVSASNSVAMPSDCNNMISSLSVNSNPLIISIDVENKFIYVIFKDSTKKVAAFEYADCLRNIDGLIKNQIYYIGNVKINYYDSKSSVSKGITGNAIASSTTSTPRSSVTRTAATTRTSPSGSPTTRTAVTTPSGVAASIAKNAVSNSATKAELNVDKIVDFRGYKYFAGNSGKRSSVYIRNDGAVYLQRPSFGGIVTDYFFPDKKLGNISSEPAGNFIDLDAAVEKSLGSELFVKLNGKLINDAGNVISAPASRELKIAGPDGTDMPSGIIIDGRGYLHPSNNQKETIGIIDKTGKISMYDPATYSATTKATLGSVAGAIHDTQATNGVIKSLAKVSNDPYSTPTSRTTAPSSAIRTSNSTAPSTIRTTPATSTTSPRTTNPTPGTTPPKTTTTTPSISCETRCAQSTGYNTGLTTTALLPGWTAEDQAAQNQLRTNYETCVINCNTNVGTSPANPITRPGTGTTSRPGVGGTSPGGGSSKPGTPTKPGTGTSGGNCVPGSAALMCGCGSSALGGCIGGVKYVNNKPQYMTLECVTGTDGKGNLKVGVSNCEGLDSSGCKKVAGVTACDPKGAPVSCKLPNDEDWETSGIQKCEQDTTTLECKLGSCVAKEEKKPALAPSTPARKPRSK